MTSPNLLAAASSTRTPADVQGERLTRATHYARQLWGSARGVREEEELIKTLESYCRRLCGGNRAAATSLASDAIWNV